MNLIKILERLYMEMFSWAFESEMDMNRVFNDLHNFHNKALPESENKIEQMYAKTFKNNFFYLIAPIVYLFLKYQATKWTHPEFLQRLVEKEMED